LKKLQEEGTTFTPEQRSWLDMMESHIATSLKVEKDSLEYTPFKEQGGLFTAYKIFENKLDEILVDINRELVTV
jgi:hypothetical protein